MGEDNDSPKFICVRKNKTMNKTTDGMEEIILDIEKVLKKHKVDNAIIIVRKHKHYKSIEWHRIKSNVLFSILRENVISLFNSIKQHFKG